MEAALDYVKKQACVIKKSACIHIIKLNHMNNSAHDLVIWLDSLLVTQRNCYELLRSKIFQK